IAGELLKHVDLIGEELALTIRAFTRSSVHRSLTLTAETRRVALLLASRGVRTAVFKGALLSAAAHGNLGIRQTGDIDLFIQKGDCEKAIAILDESGYRIGPSWSMSVLWGHLAFDCECELINR